MNHVLRRWGAASMGLLLLPIPARATGDGPAIFVRFPADALIASSWISGPSLEMRPGSLKHHAMRLLNDCAGEVRVKASIPGWIPHALGIEYNADFPAKTTKQLLKSIAFGDLYSLAHKLHRFLTDNARFQTAAAAFVEKHYPRREWHRLVLGPLEEAHRMPLDQALARLLMEEVELGPDRRGVLGLLAGSVVRPSLPFRALITRTAGAFIPFFPPNPDAIVNSIEMAYSLVYPKLKGDIQVLTAKEMYRHLLAAPNSTTKQKAMTFIASASTEHSANLGVHLILARTSPDYDDAYENMLYRYRRDEGPLVVLEKRIQNLTDSLDPAIMQGLGPDGNPEHRVVVNASMRLLPKLHDEVDKVKTALIKLQSNYASNGESSRGSQGQSANAKSEIQRGKRYRHTTKVFQNATLESKILHQPEVKAAIRAQAQVVMGRLMTDRVEVVVRIESLTNPDRRIETHRDSEPYSPDNEMQVFRVRVQPKDPTQRIEWTAILKWFDPRGRSVLLDATQQEARFAQGRADMERLAKSPYSPAVYGSWRLVIEGHPYHVILEEDALPQGQSLDQIVENPALRVWMPEIVSAYFDFYLRTGLWVVQDLLRGNIRVPTHDKGSVKIVDRSLVSDRFSVPGIIEEWLDSARELSFLKPLGPGFVWAGIALALERLKISLTDPAAVRRHQELTVAA